LRFDDLDMEFLLKLYCTSFDAVVLLKKIRWISISWKLHFGTNDLDGKTAQADLNMYSFSSHDMVYCLKV